MMRSFSAAFAALSILISSFACAESAAAQTIFYDIKGIFGSTTSDPNDYFGSSNLNAHSFDLKVSFDLADAVNTFSNDPSQQGYYAIQGGPAFSGAPNFGKIDLTTNSSTKELIGTYYGQVTIDPAYLFLFVQGFANSGESPDFVLNMGQNYFDSENHDFPAFVTGTAANRAVAYAPDTFSLRIGGPLGDSLFALDAETISFSVSAAPEPASWAMVIAGFGLIGATMRRRGTASIA